MRRQLVRTLAVLAVCAAGAAPALAGSPFEDGAGPGQGSQRVFRTAPLPRRGPVGLFTCSFREQRTKLERKNCGGTRY